MKVSAARDARDLVAFGSFAMQDAAKPDLVLVRSPNSSTGYKFVYAFNKPECGRFQAKLKAGGEQRHLGYYETAEDAAAAVAVALGRTTVDSLNRAVSELGEKAQARNDYTRTRAIAGLKQAAEMKGLTKAQRRAAVVERAAKRAKRLEECQQSAANAIVAMSRVLSTE